MTDLPPVPRFRALRVVLALARRGAFGQLALFLAAYAMALVNRSFMALEDLCVPALARVPLDRVVLILGHHRSGTTNLHKELGQHPDVVVGTNLDLLFPSLFLNRLARSRPVRWVSSLLDRGVRKLWDSPNHAVGFDEELEEHLWLLHRVRGEALSIMFPALLAATSEAEYARAITPDDADVAFVRRCLQRILHARQPGNGGWYVARPLMFTMTPELVARHFPESRILLCLREPAGAIRSHLGLTQQQMRCAPDDPRLVLWAKRFYAAGSQPQYTGMRAMLADEAFRPRLLPIPFTELKRDTPAMLQRILAFLGLRAVELHPVRSETHGAGPVTGVIAPAQIASDLGDTWRDIEQLLKPENRPIANARAG